MKLIGRNDLKVFLTRADALLGEPVDLLLVGGAAILVHAPDAVATKDIDAFPTESLPRLLDALRSEPRRADLDINTASAAFEAYLEADWGTRVYRSAEFSTPQIHVLTPSREDLAVMKVFRYVAKDAEDIERLAALPGFDTDRFEQLFCRVLPIAIGDPRRHAQSFSFIWNHLYPERTVEIEAVLRRAGR